MEATKTKKPRLTKKQKGFVKEYLDTGNGTQSALKVYDTKDNNTAAAIASENLTKPKIRAYLDEKAERAAERVVELSEQEENLPVALGASKDILDRAIGKVPDEKPPEKSTINYNFIQNTAIQADIRQLEDAIKAKLLNNVPEN